MCAKKFIRLIINVLCKNHVSLTVQFFDTTVHFLYTILLSSLHYPPVSVTLSSCLLLHYPPVSVTHFSSFLYSYSLVYIVQSNVFNFYTMQSNGYTMQSQWIYRTKAKDK